MATQCAICGNTKNNIVFQAKEKLYGSGETFEYLHCPQCDTLQLQSPIADISRYYPKDYVSFTAATEQESYKGLWGYLHKKRDAYPIVHKGVIGRLLYKLKPSSLYSMYDYLQLKRDSKVLDVGAGNGSRLCILNQICGLNHLTGIDPYIDADIHYPSGINVFKKDIFQMEGEWDIILFHHSFEHLENPFKVLEKAASLLKKGGICMLFIPICDSYAYRHYQENWVGLDAPRHFYLYSVKSCRLLGEKSGLPLEHYLHNSTSFQFTGSELYKKDIALLELNNAHFSKKELRRFEKEAHKLNRKGEGDQAAFYFRKPY
jgi:SAM-dependent methyltransferase